MKNKKQAETTKLLSKISTKTLRKELGQRSEKSEVTKEIIKIVAGATAVTLGMLLAPQATATICKVIYDSQNKHKYSRNKSLVKQTVERLRSQKILSVKKLETGETVIKLTQNGKKKLLKYQLTDLTIPAPIKWDGLWRIVLFDIPEDKREGRDLLRSMIKRLGMRQLQRSAWVYPYPCKNEIDFVSAYYGIGKYILYLETKELENESHYLQLFNLNR